jgi:hypothetical protein
MNHDVTSRAVRSVRGADIAPARPTGTEPFRPDRPQRVIARDHDIGAVFLEHVLVDQSLLGPHAHPRPMQALRAHGEHRFPDRLDDARMPTAGSQPAAVDAPGTRHDSGGANYSRHSGASSG